ncbi:MAG: TIGR00266 family protein [Myxococcota bacterium]
MQIDIMYQPGAALAKCTLQQGEIPLRAEAGAMVGMSPGVNMETSSGGLLKGMKSLLGGESFFTNKFSGGGEVLLAAALPGDLAVLNVGPGSGWRIAKGAFVGCDDSVNVETKFGGLKAMFSGTGLAHLETSGQGQVIVGAFGAVERQPVNGSYIVDNGHIVAWSEGLTYKVSKSGSGIIASILSGEGLVCTFSGQGEVLIQTRNADEFGKLIGPMMPPR